MAFEISEFASTARQGDSTPPAPAEAVHTGAGAVVLGASTTLLRITGTVTVTWGNGVAEHFTVLEHRKVRPGTSITLA